MKTPPASSSRNRPIAAANRSEGKSAGLSATKLSAPKKLLFAALATLAFFVIVEGTLASLTEEETAIPPDRFVGFSPSVPLMIPDWEFPKQDSGSAEILRTNPAKLTWFNDQSFPKTKSPGTYRIVCLGGSTTYGRPFDDTTSFSGWLRELLPLASVPQSSPNDQSSPIDQWEVINAGGISYASYRVAAVMEELSRYDVDLFIVYTGQNEFLEWRTYSDTKNTSETTRWLSSLASRTHLGRWLQSTADAIRQGSQPRADQPRADQPRADQSASDTFVLPGEVDEMLNHSIGPADYTRDLLPHESVQRHLRANLQRMLVIAESVGARLAVVSPVSNLRDCAPFKARFSDSLDSEIEQQLAARLQAASQALQDGEVEQALADLQDIRRIDDQNAQVDFLMGQSFLLSNQPAAAKEAFERALDHDICPLRATSGIRRVISDFSQQPKVMEIDFASSLERSVNSRLGHPCFGDESFLDHVHLTIDAHRDLAVLIMREMQAQKIIAKSPDDADVMMADDFIRAGLDRNAQAIAFRNLAKVMHWAGKFDQAERSARDALRLLPNELESRYLLADCLVKRGEYLEAEKQYTTLFEIGTFDRAMLPFGELLASLGHTTAAKAYLTQAVVVENGQRQIFAYEALGKLHESLGETELAEQCYREARAGRTAESSGAK